MVSGLRSNNAGRLVSIFPNPTSDTPTSSRKYSNVGRRLDRMDNPNTCGNFTTNSRTRSLTIRRASSFDSANGTLLPFLLTNPKHRPTIPSLRKCKVGLTFPSGSYVSAKFARPTIICISFKSHPNSRRNTRALPRTHPPSVLNISGFRNTILLNTSGGYPNESLYARIFRRRSDRSYPSIAGRRLDDIDATSNVDSPNSV
mmetsp:Transcript_5158/g.14853  ORF Transcript_5158/g.14853 Transcript_5158/m.14853 type:complete len:201 (+) Transcript_5158:321-923(+)